MLNLPIRLRYSDEYCTPKGPTIQQARPVRINVDGTDFEFKAPRHNSSNPGYEASVPRRQYLLPRETFRTYDGDDQYKRWKYLSVLFRSWSFYGPWLTGRKAELSFSVNILMPSKPQADVSFYHPRAFESAIASYLTDHYSKPDKWKKVNWCAPMHWARVESLPCVAARLEVHPIWKNHPAGAITKNLFLPIGDHFLFHFSFTPTLLGKGPEWESEKYVDPAPVNQLLEDIIASLKVTLSPEAKAKQAKALEGLSDTSLTPTFPPLKWTDDDSDSQGSTHHQLQNA